MSKAISAFEFEFRTITGEALPLSRFEGNPVLVVNTASQCGLTPQYRELQGLWEKYRRTISARRSPAPSTRSPNSAR